MTKSGSGSANADRVRENQRRCRARKREYVVSLEERLRRCQEAGVKANVELQEVAQRVVDENRELRALLHQQGLSDYDIQVKLSVLRVTSGARVLPNSTKRELPVASQLLAPDTSRRRSQDKFVTRIACGERTDILQHEGIGSPDSFKPILLSPLQSPRHFTSDINSPTTPSTTASSPAAPSPTPSSPASSSPPITMIVAGSKNTPLSPTSEMGILCSLFAPRTIAASSCAKSSTCCSSSTPSGSSANVVGGQSPSTPCSVAYSLLTTLNSRRRQQQDLVALLLELLGGFCPAPEGDVDGCRVDNDILIPVMNKLLIE